MQEKNKSLEKELAASKQLLEEAYIPLVETAGEAFYLVDRACNYLFITNDMANQFGTPLQEVIGKNYGDFHGPEVARLFAERVAEVLAKGVTIQDEHVNREGAKTIYRTFYPVKSPQGDVIKVAVLSQDITNLKVAERRLNNTLSLLTATLEAAASGILAVDKRGEILTSNSKFAQMWHIPEEIITAKKIDPLLTVVCNQLIDAEGFLVQRQDRIRLPASEFSDELLLKDGRIFERTSKPQWSDGEIVGRVYSFTDITTRKNNEENLRKNEERYRTIIENIEEGYYEVDLAGSYHFVNEACLNIFGYSRSEILGFNSDKFTDGENRAKINELFKIVSASGDPSLSCEWTVLRKNGEKRHVESSISPIRDAHGNAVGFRGVIRDVTAKKKAEETIHHMAYHDFLTGLPNRFLFQDRLNMALAQARRNKGKIALVTLDLDRFKEINDTLGHDIGDVLLQKVGKRLTGLIREGDTVARMGGDEFTLLLQSINDNSDVTVIAVKVLEALREPFDCDEHELSITPSIGIAIYPDHGLAMSTVLKNADQAMYRAKKTRNRYYVYGQL